jgi:hypothetical protein
VRHYYEHTRNAKEEEAFVRRLHDFDVIRERHGWSLRHRLPPEMLSRRKLAAQFITKVLAVASRVVRWLEVLLRPRLEFLHEQWIYQRIAGALIVLSGLLMLLPQPIPLTNSLPALTVILLAAGAKERDGLFFLAGCATFTVTLAYFGLLAFGGAHLLNDLLHAVFGA